MFEDELFLRVGFQHDRVFIERAHTAGYLQAVQQMHRDMLPGREGYIEERFLYAYRRHDFSR